jgi:hypothetical protein
LRVPDGCLTPRRTGRLTVRRNLTSTSTSTSNATTVRYVTWLRMVLLCVTWLLYVIWYDTTLHYMARHWIAWYCITLNDMTLHFYEPWLLLHSAHQLMTPVKENPWSNFKFTAFELERNMPLTMAIIDRLSANQWTAWLIHPTMNANYSFYTTHDMNNAVCYPVEKGSFQPVSESKAKPFFHLIMTPILLHIVQTGWGVKL